MRRQVKPAWHMERLVTTIVNDPKYLTQEFITSTDFRKEPDGARWKPTSCAVD